MQIRNLDSPDRKKIWIPKSEVKLATRSRVEIERCVSSLALQVLVVVVHCH